ncbi:hypothetical protein GT204_17840 [Streptomyces sp. SID4919]|uniref:hypothetical protein n=1 Tax=Streptomyces sp. AmelKG-E11A TaxID=1100822 RepID=UPI00082385FF|nr:hypothetical protein [Streptomyces sp. AmelKG-E11A]MYY10718.1 hypothetical protein [Streptomyces sp. SID4919]SCK62365.1 hypothetical protein YW7DRAFT_06600 [Streptomyces sp. AmelKG-E11A]
MVALDRWEAAEAVQRFNGTAVPEHHAQVDVIVALNGLTRPATDFAGRHCIDLVGSPRVGQTPAQKAAKAARGRRPKKRPGKAQREAIKRAQAAKKSSGLDDTALGLLATLTGVSADAVRGSHKADLGAWSREQQLRDHPRPGCS